MTLPNPFPRAPINGAEPCESYRGYATAVLTFNGTPVVVMALTRYALSQVCREICGPQAQIDTELFVPAHLIHDRHVIQEDV